jgi:hypothetical protein
VEEASLRTPGGFLQYENDNINAFCPSPLEEISEGRLLLALAMIHVGTVPQQQGYFMCLSYEDMANPWSCCSGRICPGLVGQRHHSGFIQYEDDYIIAFFPSLLLWKNFLRVSFAWF